MCLHVYVHMCTRVYVHVKTEDGFQMSSLITLPLSSWFRVFHWAWDSSIQLDWLSHELPDPPVFVCPTKSSGITDMHHHTHPAFTWWKEFPQWTICWAHPGVLNMCNTSSRNNRDKRSEPTRRYLSLSEQSASELDFEKVWDVNRTEWGAHSGITERQSDRTTWHCSVSSLGTWVANQRAPSVLKMVSMQWLAWEHSRT